MKTKPIIADPNSSGQGHHDSYKRHPLFALCRDFYYKYSHSTVIGYHDGWFMLHTFVYKTDDNVHTVSLKDNGESLDFSLYWQTSCGGQSKYSGRGYESLRKHLSCKARRYHLSQNLVENNRFVAYHVTGLTTKGRRFRKAYGADGLQWAMGINLLKGSVWGVLDNDKRVKLKSIY